MNLVIFALLVRGSAFDLRMRDNLCTCLTGNSNRICVVEPFMEGSKDKIVKFMDLQKGVAYGKVNVVCLKQAKKEVKSAVMFVKAEQ